MTEPLINTDHRKLTLRHFIASFFLNALVNTVIAAVLTAIRFGHGFQVNLIFSQCIGFSIYFANWAAAPLFRKTKRPAAQVAIVVFAILIGALAGTLLGVLASGFDPVLFLKERFPFFMQIIILAILFGVIVSYVFLSLEKMSQERLQRVEIEKAAMEAELRLVQSQIEPHFLFNTLANVRGLIDSDPRMAGAMLESFVSFLRTSLHAARERTVPLSREMDLVTAYLELMASRMRDRLRYCIELPEDLRGVPVPPLLIQPLAENAVRHGLEPSIAGGEIAILVLRTGDLVRIVVSDSGQGLQEHGTGGGVGLENVRKRLHLHYGGKGRLELEENKPRGVRVTVELPYTYHEAGLKGQGA
jgi:sensor histidine kinase YesM